ncbi:hypothetical protein D3C73_1563770 [compost metagenome]
MESWVSSLRKRDRKSRLELLSAALKLRLKDHPLNQTHRVGLLHSHMLSRTIQLQVLLQIR